MTLLACNNKTAIMNKGKNVENLSDTSGLSGPHYDVATHRSNLTVIYSESFN